MAANNLLSMFPLSTLLVLTVTRQWVLGQTICILNQAITYMMFVPNLMLHMFISWERHRAVLHFFEWKLYSKRTHIELGVMWTVAVVSGVYGVATLLFCPMYTSSESYATLDKTVIQVVVCHYLA